MSKNDYLKDYAKKFNEKNPDADFDLDDLSKEEKNELYKRYVDNAKRVKEQFVANKYLENQELTIKIPQQTMAERIAAEDARLTRLGEAPIKNESEKAIDNKVDAPKVKQENTVEQIVIDENEPEVKAEEKAKLKEEEKVEGKEKEKVVDDKGGERFTLDLDEGGPELNSQMLGENNEVQIENDLDPLKRG